MASGDLLLGACESDEMAAFAECMAEKLAEHEYSELHPNNG